MKYSLTIILSLICFGVFGQGVIPKPTEVVLRKGFIDLNDVQFNFIILEATQEETSLREGLIALLKTYLPKRANSANHLFVNIEIMNSTKRKGAYKLVIDTGGVGIAGDSMGIFNAIQTVRQLIFQSNGKLQCQTIIDSPAFAWRGMHLDCSRHFFDIDFIKKYIDILALHKMNTFHWHLTDDQGWRIEIKKYPLLTKIGSQRSETIVGKNFDPYKGDGTPYGGFYTQEQIKEVVAYAAERYITVVPEIEMPGHAVAVLTAYPQFSCNQEPLETLTTWGVSEDIFCSKDATFQLLFDVLDEVLELFPSKYIHIGGDEAPKTRWKNCGHCQANIKKHNLKDEHELQSYFIGRIDSFLTSKGRKTIGWDEILEGGLAPNAAVMSWRGEQGGRAAAQQKHNVVMSPTSHCYFDHYQGDKKTEPLAIGGYTPLKKVYDFNPIPNELSKEASKYILGAQGNLWTEYIETPEHAMYMALPRLCALSEVLWSGVGKNSYENFTSRLIPHFDMLDSMGCNYSKALFNIEAKPIFKNGEMKVALNSEFKEYAIRYTTDDTEPTAKSDVYTMPILINKDVVLKAILFDGTKAKENLFSQEYKYHQAVGKEIKLSHSPSESYNTGGAQTLVDGIVGTLPWSGNEWLGWRGQDTLEILVNLGEERTISSIKFSFLEAKESWIHLPKKVIFEKDKFHAGLVIRPELFKNEDNSFELKTLTNYSRRYLRFYIITDKKIPEGHPGAGEKPWLFCSEIIVQ